MRSILTSGGIATFISTQEYTFLESLDDVAYKSKMSVQEAELARRLNSRGVLQRFKNDKGIYYVLNQNRGIN